MREPWEGTDLRRMAVVKVSCTCRRGAVKAHLRYITHRPGKDTERTTRLLFGQDGRFLWPSEGM